MEKKENPRGCRSRGSKEKKKLTVFYGKGKKMFPQSRKVPVLSRVVSLLALFAVPAPSPATVVVAESENATVRELWYRVEIAGAPAGHMVAWEIEDGDRLTTESTLRLELERAGTSQSMQMSSRFVETVDHRPVSAWAEQRLGKVPMETSYLFTEDGIVATGASGERRLDAPEGPWLTPFAAGAAVAENVRRLTAATSDGEAETSFEIRTVDPTLGPEPFVTRWELLEREARITVDGVEHRVSRWRQSPAYAPTVTSTVEVDGEGELIRSTTPVMGLEMTVVLSTREAVEGRSSSAAPAPAPELLVPTFIYPDRPIERPRQLRRAVYRLRFAGDGEMPVIPQTTHQDVEVVEDGVRVIVDLADDGSDVGPAHSETYLGSTDYLRHDDPFLVELRRKALKDAPADAAARAEILRRFVARRLQGKNLDSILATASEAARNASGDCTEHAVLLGALLRGDGIPSRVAVGVIYAERFGGKRDLFAYHMWTQASIDGIWVDLDATLDVPFDAAHIALGTSALGDLGSALLDMASAGPLVGRLEIEVEEVGYGDRDE